jgi:hypothetical protein
MNGSASWFATNEFSIMSAFFTLLLVVATALIARRSKEPDNRRDPNRIYRRPHTRRTPDGRPVPVRGHWVLVSSRQMQSQSARRGPHPATRLLSRVAVIVLPAATRPRYTEEYQSELGDLAEAGIGRLGQIRYVTRVIVRSFPLGVVLRMPNRRSASS